MANRSSSSGFSFLGLGILILLVLVAGIIFVSCAGVLGQEPLPPPTPQPQIVHPHRCGCHVCCAETIVVYPPQPSYFGEVDGFKTNGQLRCHNSHSTEMGGSRQFAVGTDSVSNAQLLHGQALNVRSRDFNTANETLRALTTPPKEVVRTVNRTIILTVPAPPLPYYTVVGSTVVCDAYGRHWHYANYGWRVR